MLSDLRNRGKMPKAVREEFEWLTSQLNEFLSQIFNPDGTLVQPELLGLSMDAITAIRHEDVAFGATEISHTINVRAFAGFEDAASNEVMFHFHGPFAVRDTGTHGDTWSVGMNPKTFPTLTFVRTPQSRPTTGAVANDPADLPVSTHYWSMWRRRTA